VTLYDKEARHTVSDTFLKQLDAIAAEYADAQKRSRHDDCSDVISESQLKDLQTRCFAAIERAAGRKSVYYEKAFAVGDEHGSYYDHLARQIGVVNALRQDIAKGYLRSFEQLIHGEVFGDFLEMADYLVTNGYKDAAAVVAGSTLEAHLRHICKQFGVATDHGGKPKKADTINADLAKTGAYSKLDQKNVTAWLGLRNKAAHGNYGEYDSSQVQLLVGSIRDFIARHPA